MKIVINRVCEGIDTWNQELLEKLIEMGWTCTSLSEDKKGTPKDKTAFISANYADCLITLDVNGQTLETVLRTHVDFIKIIEENLLLSCSHYSVIEIPDEIEYYIHDDGCGEEVHEAHRTWC